MMKTEESIDAYRPDNLESQWGNRELGIWGFRRRYLPRRRFLPLRAALRGRPELLRADLFAHDYHI